ncbi:hypothetical protein [Methyloversatilis sp.]|uniref:hypothetical protein n=1 Tax=Methyloversatilis sp. TaxID=2569862 RepID=UPI0027351B48|nr:hypothetical protein [Methyloversatilis sp.]
MAPTICPAMLIPCALPVLAGGEASVEVTPPSHMRGCTPDPPAPPEPTTCPAALIVVAVVYPSPGNSIKENVYPAACAATA